MRSPWFRFWVDVAAAGIMRAEYAVLRLGCPTRPRSGAWPDAAVWPRRASSRQLALSTVCLWAALHPLSWLYHRCLDAAGIGL